LAGSQVVINDTCNYGLFFVVIDPERVIPGGGFKAQVSALRRAVLATRPLSSESAVRVPGDGSQARRKQALQSGVITLDDKVYARILELTS
jgi:LDH2 family malate/lactate/ureidoglycolate dehydrogenase